MDADAWAGRAFVVTGGVAGWGGQRWNPGLDHRVFPSDGHSDWAGWRAVKGRQISR